MNQKDKKVEFILCVVLGFYGVHKFYKGEIVKGVIYFLTGGLLLIGWIIDIITLAKELNTSPPNLPKYKCTYCGSYLSVEEGQNAVCNSCGARIFWDEIQRMEKEAEEKETKEKRNTNVFKKWWFWLIAFWGPLIIIGVVAVCLNPSLDLSWLNESKNSYIILIDESSKTSSGDGYTGFIIDNDSNHTVYYGVYLTYYKSFEVTIEFGRCTSGFNKDSSPSSIILEGHPSNEIRLFYRLSKQIVNNTFGEKYNGVYSVKENGSSEEVVSVSNFLRLDTAKEKITVVDKYGHWHK